MASGANKRFGLLFALVAIIAIFLGWHLYRVASSCWESTPEGRTVKAECMVMHALIGYKNNYGKMPDAEGKELIAILCGENRNGLNPENRRFLETTPEEMKDGLIVDGWGNPLIINLNHSLNEFKVSSSHKAAAEAFHSFGKP